MITTILRVLSPKGKVLTERKEETTEEERQAAEERHQKTHPPQVDRIQGCCDRADQS